MTWQVWYLKDMIPSKLLQGLRPGFEIYKHDELHELVKYHNRFALHSTIHTILLCTLHVRATFAKIILPCTNI